MPAFTSAAPLRLSLATRGRHRMRRFAAGSRPRKAMAGRLRFTESSAALQAGSRKAPRRPGSRRRKKKLQEVNLPGRNLPERRAGSGTVTFESWPLARKGRRSIRPRNTRTLPRRSRSLPCGMRPRSNCWLLELGWTRSSFAALAMSSPGAKPPTSSFRVQAARSACISQTRTSAGAVAVIR